MASCGFDYRRFARNDVPNPIGRRDSCNWVYARLVLSDLVVGRKRPSDATTGMLDAKFTHTPELEEAMSSWRRERNGDGGEHTR